MAWDAKLKKTSVRLDNITDAPMYVMIESGMRGAVWMISKRHSRATKCQMGKLDVEQPLSCIVDLDAKNKYGSAMTQFIPLSGFKWVPKEEWARWDWWQMVDEANVG